MTVESRNIPFRACCIAVLVASVLANEALLADSVVVRGGHHWGVPIIAKMAEAWQD